MITGTVDTLSLYNGLIDQAETIQQYLADANFPAVGVWTVLNDRLKVIRLADWNRTNTLYETHTQNYDLHVTLSGMDRMRVCLDVRDASIANAYDQEKDFTLYSGKEDAVVLLKKNHWLFLLPSEPHRNEFSEDATEKLVFKIKVS